MLLYCAFACTCTHTSCNATVRFLVFAHIRDDDDDDDDADDDDDDDVGDL